MSITTEDLKFSVLIPVYDMETTIGETLKSILAQSYKNFEIIVQDNDSRDNTAKIIKSFKDKRIIYFKNQKNIGPALNLVYGQKNCSGDIIYLMAADDLMDRDALLKTHRAFKISPDIGAVTRPYFWFDKSVKIPVRAKKQCDSKKDTIITINDCNRKIVYNFLSTLDQLSGLAYRKKYMDKTFRDDIWTCHSYPLLSIFKKYPVVALKDYVIAVRIGRSGTRCDIYRNSPMMSWINMFKDVFSETKFQEIKNDIIRNFVATNYVGLVQIRSYGSYVSFLREIFYLVKYRPENLISPMFWIFSLGCLITPSFLLAKLVDWYKNTLYSKTINKIEFNLS